MSLRFTKFMLLFFYNNKHTDSSLHSEVCKKCDFVFLYLKLQFLFFVIILPGDKSLDNVSFSEI